MSQVTDPSAANSVPDVPSRIGQQGDFAGASPSRPDGLDLDAALRAIQDAVNEVTGKRVPIAFDTRMDRYFNGVVGNDDLEYLDLSFKLEDRLGVRLSTDDWTFLGGGNLCKSIEDWEAKYAEFFTFGRLAELVVARAKLGGVTPVTILGATSESAGAFRAIERIATSLRADVEPFAPSTRILDRFRGQDLVKLWARLRILSRNRVPPLHKTRLVKVLETIYKCGALLIAATLILGSVGALLSSILGVANIVGVFGLSSGLLGVSGSLLLLLCAVAWGVLYRLVKLLEPRDVILPNGIKSFRDLAELISGDRGGWCEKCGYDLTGLENPRCPECGADLRPAPMPTE